ncbi:MAG: ATP-binding protein [Chloroflexi bacterium]|nr:ATP-binding protein [Chloroflexota bacterium]
MPSLFEELDADVTLVKAGQTAQNETGEPRLVSAGGDSDVDGQAWDDGSVGRTMFDLPTSADNSVTVLLPREHTRQVPSQALVRILSRDGRNYLGTVVAGPFHEPDALRADSHLLVTIVTRSGIFLPQHHGRVQVEIMGEELENGTLVPPRFRPLPNSPVERLDDAEVGAVLHTAGEIALGQVAGQEAVDVGIPATDKAVLPRHTAILGTTGGGKSTTVARLVQQAQRAGCAVVLLDVEGEYTSLHEPTEAQPMLVALERRGQTPAGVENVTLYHLAGRETANPDHPNRQEFSLQLARLSPYTVAEILDLSEAQTERFFTAYDIASAMLRQLGIFPAKGQPEQERLAQDLDEFERGYPRLTLTRLIDAASACLCVLDKDEDNFSPRDSVFAPARDELLKRARTRKPTSSISWRTLLARLWRLQRLKVFDREPARGLAYKRLLRPGHVSIVDLSDTGSPALNNLVIADLLLGIQEAQDDAYETYERARRNEQQEASPARTLVVIEEAHEFLSKERLTKMPTLFQQVARIAKRGRKRWLGLVFVTQLPQHLPNELFGLVNSYVLHKISDPGVASELQRTIPGIDEALWRRLPGLAPGQAIVSFPHLTRPVLVAVDPTPARLRLVD